MREIKFRGKARDGTWVFGYYVVAENLHYITSDKHIPHNSGFIGGAVLLHDIAGFREVDPKTIGQYTGRKDKNGKEIWGGAIITFIPSDGSTNIRQKAVVYYCEKRTAFCVKSNAWDMPLFNCKEIDIIGNIHDNPE